MYSVIRSRFSLFLSLVVDDRSISYMHDFHLTRVTKQGKDRLSEERRANTRITFNVLRKCAYDKGACKHCSTMRNTLRVQHVHEL